MGIAHIRDAFIRQVRSIHGVEHKAPDAFLAFGIIENAAAWPAHSTAREQLSVCEDVLEKPSFGFLVEIRPLQVPALKFPLPAVLVRDKPLRSDGVARVL